MIEQIRNKLESIIKTQQVKQARCCNNHPAQYICVDDKCTHQPPEPKKDEKKPQIIRYKDINRAKCGNDNCGCKKQFHKHCSSAYRYRYINKILKINDQEVSIFKDTLRLLATTIHELLGTYEKVNEIAKYYLLQPELIQLKKKIQTAGLVQQAQAEQIKKFFSRFEEVSYQIPTDHRLLSDVTNKVNELIEPSIAASKKVNDNILMILQSHKPVILSAFEAQHFGSEQQKTIEDRNKERERILEQSQERG